MLHWTANSSLLPAPCQQKCTGWFPQKILLCVLAVEQPVLKMTIAIWWQAPEEFAALPSFDSHWSWLLCQIAWLPLKYQKKKLKNRSYQVKKKGRILLHVFLSYVYVPSGNCSLSGFAASTAKDCHTTCKGGAFVQPGLTLRSEFSFLESELICFRWKPKCQPACKQYRWQVTER